MELKERKVIAHGRRGSMAHGGGAAAAGTALANDCQRQEGQPPLPTPSSRPLRCCWQQVSVFECLRDLALHRGPAVLHAEARRFRQLTRLAACRPRCKHVLR